MKTQPKLGTRKLHKTALKTAAKLSVKRIPHTTNTADRIAAIQNTVGSILGLSALSSTGLLP
jgi:predicted subunit of tRNA(5-methylaminomethyl-2-thiouridylate) methyltransferase